jgi:uncharacterized SAM-binding protein YcdF (DUF218 family)
VLVGRLALVAVIVAALLGGFTVRLFVWPPSSRPERADAVVVLSGDHGERLPRALRLMRAGAAPTLVVAGEPDMLLTLQMCQEPQPFEVVCLRPDPDSTRAEARSTGRLAASRGWERIVVVTTTHHQTRAHLMFRRCFEGHVDAVGADPPYDWRFSLRQVVHEVLGMSHALILERSC